eukprot:5548805-Pyramimonas_sp.AAC.1
MKDAEKKRLAKEGWDQTGWKTWSHEGGGKWTWADAPASTTVPGVRGWTDPGEGRPNPVLLPGA